MEGSRPHWATTDLSGFPIVVTTDLRWGDMDAFGHVNNTLFLRYFEMARVAHFEAIGFDRAEGTGPILGHVTCRYIRPLTYPDQIRIGARVTEVGEDRFTQGYVLVSGASGAQERVAAVGEGVVVAYDYDKGRRGVLPEEVKGRIRALEAAGSS
jgi:acyl-CoA thioester hydrolase